MTIRLTYPEYTDLKTRAGSEGMALSDYVRAQLVTVRIDADVRAELAAMRKTLEQVLNSATRGPDPGIYTLEGALILRELAAARDAQILTRVRARLEQSNGKETL